ncbi:UBP1-associated protein 2B-like [Tasmannia lanceolata]|uniref:UBP1-associated protein 2B-like n=1 Tax=Tasmannia lanceolata TaxID=3420 RepID=UPI004062F3E5
MAKNKKQKLEKKALKKLKKSDKKKKKQSEKSIAVPDPNPDSEPEPEPESDSEKIQKLLEPYTKDQLIEFLCEAAVSDSALLHRIRTTADHDVSHRKIFVHGLGWDTTRETLVSVFEPFGEIEDINVVIDKNTGRAKGYGFVLFKTRVSAAKALKQPQKKIKNRVASCQLASVGPVPLNQNYDTAGRKIYVSNVHSDADSDKLRAFFGKFGEIETGPIGYDLLSGKSRGFALFVYKTLEGAKKVLEEPYKMFEGHQLHCSRATDSSQKAKMGIQPPQATALAAAAAVQNLALFTHNPSLNPAFNTLLANQNAGLFAGSVNPLAATMLNPSLSSTPHMPANSLGSTMSLGSYGASGLGGYGASGLGGYGASGLGLGGYGASHGLGSLSSNSSVLGAYGSQDSSLQGFQSYQSPNLGQNPALQGLKSYQNTQLGQSSSVRTNVTGGFPSYM